MSKVDVELIRVGQRLRGISDAQVEALVNSIADVGLLNPITVYPRSVVVGGISTDGYGLIAGAHRLEACKRLGLAEIDVHITELSELERQIAECDENLCASSLTPAERAMFTARRKEAYEALHPETKNGGDRRGPDRQVGELKEADRFTADTAAKTGESERTVQRNAERGEKIDRKALELVKSTKLDNGAYLDKLKAMPAPEQIKRVRSDLAATKAVKSDHEVILAQANAIVSAWNRACPEARELAMAEIDAPLMDKRYG